ncbi:MAG: hypothetical protein WCH75_18770, partial [Candidatus Binatia bacterium]
DLSLLYTRRSVESISVRLLPSTVTTWWPFSFIEAIYKEVFQQRSVSTRKSGRLFSQSGPGFLFTWQNNSVG